MPSPRIPISSAWNWQWICHWSTQTSANSEVEDALYKVSIGCVIYSVQLWSVALVELKLFNITKIHIFMVDKHFTCMAAIMIETYIEIINKARLLSCGTVVKPNGEALNKPFMSNTQITFPLSLQHYVIYIMNPTRIDAFYLFEVWWCPFFSAKADSIYIGLLFATP